MNQSPQQLRLHFRKYGPGPRHPDFRTFAPRPTVSASQVLSDMTNNTSESHQTTEDWLLLNGSTSSGLGSEEQSTMGSARRDEEGQVRSRPSSFDFFGSLPDQDDDDDFAPGLHNSPEPDDDLFLYPLEHQPPPVNQIRVPEDAQFSEIPTEQELEEFHAIKKLLPSDSVPPAFRESAAVRLIYLHAVKASIFHNHTDDDCNRRITEDLDILDAAGILPTNPAPARTLVTAKRRLGLDVDLYIHKQPICTVCYKHYSLEDIAKLSDSNCTVRRCKGQVY